MAQRLVKNLRDVYDLLSEEDIVKIEWAAKNHRQYNGLFFQVEKAGQKKIIFHVNQGRSPSGNYFTQKRLIEIVHESFDNFFPGIKIHVHAKPFQEPLVDQVNPLWVQDRMLKLGVKLKDIVADTGIDKTYLSDLLSNTNPKTFSQPVKAMFYYYFLNKESPVK